MQETFLTCWRASRSRSSAGGFHPGPSSQYQNSEPLCRVKLHCRFINRGIEYVSGFGIKWTSGSAKRQCDRALPGWWTGSHGHRLVLGCQPVGRGVGAGVVQET
jgi:hypothetical protein